MRQILLFAALATSLALLSGCTLSKTKADTAEDMTGKAASEMPEALPDKEATLLVYCRSGRRSKDAAQKLLALGYQSVYDFGGVIDWPYELVKEG
ncbi:MAG: rhodanese-like domain-containing protein [Firmicutes bacterium]|nr:rhodanese-like domain-containing protein [Bacillota bacterium]